MHSKTSTPPAPHQVDPRVQTGQRAGVSGQPAEGQGGPAQTQTQTQAQAQAQAQPSGTSRRAAELSSLTRQLETNTRRQRVLEAERLSLVAKVVAWSQAAEESSRRELDYRAARAEVATMLRVSEYRAEREMTLAYELYEHYPRTATALAEAKLDLQHVRAVIEAGYLVGAGEDDETVSRRANYEDAVLDVALQETPNRLQPVARRIAEHWATTSIDDRHRIAARKRRVTVVPLEDGMADLIAHIPAIDAFAIKEHLTRIAQATERATARAGTPSPARASVGPGMAQGLAQGLAQGREPGLAQGREPGLAQEREQGSERTRGASAGGPVGESEVAPDPRSRDELRADALRDLLLNTPVWAASRAERAGAGTGRNTAANAGNGAGADANTDTNTNTNTNTNTDTDTDTDDILGARRSGSRYTGGSNPGDALPDRAFSGKALPGKPLPDRAFPGKALPGGKTLPGKALVEVVIPISALLPGMADATNTPGFPDIPGFPVAQGYPGAPGSSEPLDSASVCELRSYGPISSDSARAVAATAKSWNRVFVDADSGAVLAVDRYRPSEEMRRFLVARDGHCRFPGCRVPTQRCDIDHTRDAAQGGPTATDNLAHLCRGHHTLKHHSDWRTTQDSGGVLTWTSPTGRTYTDRPREHLPERRRSRVAFAPS